MNPEIKLVTPEYIAAQQERFNAAAQHFGETYSRGQNMVTSIGRNIWARVTGRPTHGEQITQAIQDLTETRLNLAEVRARQTAQGIADITAYQNQLANQFSREWYATGTNILDIATVENTNYGILDGLYRANLSAGPAFRLVGGAALILAATANGLNLIQGPEAVIATEAGAFIAATGAVEVARQIFLGLYTRSRMNIIGANSVSLIRRRASIHEGQITGDELGDSDPIDLNLQARLGDEIRSQLQQDGIRRPDLTNPADVSDILRQRGSLRLRLPRYQDLNELVRSRDLARRSRLVRTILYAAAAAGVVVFQLNQPEYCGTRDFPQPDPRMEQASGGAVYISSWRGIAENEWFKRIHGRDFNRLDPDEAERYQAAYQYDPEGNDQIIEKIVVELKKKNPQIKSAGRDFLIHGTMYEICGGELDSIYDQPVPTH